ncbi:MAG: DUF2835 domain-containing protein [Pseudomonadota bacterium]
MLTTQKKTFYVSISRDQWLNYYAGIASAVHVLTDDGLSLQLPANTLRRFVTHAGIHGHFEVEFDDAFKLRSIGRFKGT